MGNALMDNFGTVIRREQPLSMHRGSRQSSILALAPKCRTPFTALARLQAQIYLCANAWGACATDPSAKAVKMSSHAQRATVVNDLAVVGKFIGRSMTTAPRILHSARMAFARMFARPLASPEYSTCSVSWSCPSSSVTTSRALPILSCDLMIRATCDG